MLRSLFIICIFFVGILNAQHPYYGSLNQQLLSTNPAFAGSNKQLRVQSDYGTFDSNLTHPSIWYYLAADILIKKHSGLGFSYTRNDFARELFIQDQWSISYAYHIIIKDKLKIVPSFQASFFQLTLDRTKLNFGENVNDIFITSNVWVWGNEVIPSQTKHNADFSAGLLMYKENFFAGASILSFTQPDQGLLGVSKRPLTQIYQVGYNFKLKSKWICDVYTFSKFQYIYVNLQKTPRNFVQIGGNFGYNKVKLHVAARIDENSVHESLIAGLNYSSKGFTLGFNATYNYINSDVYAKALQLFLAMNFGKRKKAEESSSSAPSPVKLYY